VTILQSKPFVENAQALSWVDSALEGDQKALENLSKSLRPLIFNLCQKFFLSPEDAEDNTQEILIRVITKLGLYDRQKGPSPDFSRMAVARKSRSFPQRDLAEEEARASSNRRANSSK
jgi:hypothetical protein